MEVVYRGDTRSTRQGGSRQQEEQNILSMKKSAEIAALFSGARINQTTGTAVSIVTKYSFILTKLVVEPHHNIINGLHRKLH